MIIDNIIYSVLLFPEIIIFLVIRILPNNIYTLLLYVCTNIYIAVKVGFFLKGSMTQRLNEYFIAYRAFNDRLYIVAQKKDKENIIEETECRRITYNLFNLKEKIKSNQLYCAITHENIINSLSEMGCFKTFFKIKIHYKNLLKIQEQIYRCEEKCCDKISTCGIRSFGNQKREFHLIFFKIQ